MLSNFHADGKPRPCLKTTYKPLTQKAYFLIPTILASTALVVVLQIFLRRSERDSGILFAKNVNDLPFNQTLPYLYLPTVISLLLSFAYQWIDLDVKRLQPFYQLSRSQGALGEDSLLLEYPFDFVGWVPFKALKRRHWPVFSASVAVIIIFWGLTPLQSSMFAPRTIHRTLSQPMYGSTDFVSLEHQSSFTGFYAQSVYNIVWLNETFPPFMTRHGMLAPFGPRQAPSHSESNETWSAQTQFYSVDVKCETSTINATTQTWDSNSGCSYPVEGMGLPDGIKPDQYTSQYVGYWYEESMDYYLRGRCPQQANQTFLVRFSRGQNIVRGQPVAYEPLEGISLYCRSSYYQQRVNATVTPGGKTVVDVTPVGPKTAIPSHMFNVTNFEWSTSQGYELTLNRGPYPAAGWPQSYDRLCLKYPQLYWNIYMPNMAVFALSTSQNSLVDYLDANILEDSYQAAFQLLFARRFADILRADLDHNEQSIGVRSYTTQAVTMIPDFVNIVEALLLIVVVAATVTLYLSFNTASNLTSNPASIASLMALCGNDNDMLQRLSENGCMSASQLERSIYEVHSSLTNDREGSASISSRSNPPNAIRASIQHTDVNNTSAKYTLPWNLSWVFGLSFIAFQLLIITILVLIYVSVQDKNGLPMPSSSIFWNQLVKNYIPMAVAAFFEPIWTILNRTLCMLQPYEQLRKGNSLPSRSITVDYNSLPPQAVVGRAIKAGHISLASVCLVALLANLLSLTFGGLLYENTVDHPREVIFTRPYTFPMNGDSLGKENLSSLRNIDSVPLDQFYVAMSNLTASTPLPAWTDDNHFYLPFSGGNATNAAYKAQTYAFGASLQCVPLQGFARYNYPGMSSGDSELSSAYRSNTGLNATILSPKGPACNISDSKVVWFGPSSTVNTATELFLWNLPCSNAFAAGWWRSAGQQASWLACIPSIEVTLRDVTVDAHGFIQSSAPSPPSPVLDSDQENFFEPNSSALISSVHGLLSQASSVYNVQFNQRDSTIHNDSYRSDFFNYLMVTALNSSRNLDPAMPPPSFEGTAPALRDLYSKLFAIVLGTNVKKILRRSEEKRDVVGFMILPETRLFMSMPMFVISVTIMTLYVLVTVILYWNKPWAVLPRMPTSVASQIASFAPSRALKDLSVTSAMSNDRRNRHVHGLGRRYGYGRFVGEDGRVHMGIEQEPYVQVLSKLDLARLGTHCQEQDTAVRKSRWSWVKSMWH